MQQRVAAWGDAATIICTKPAHSTVLKLGWPITDSLRGIRDHDQAVFWPQTSLKGLEREAYHERKLYELLSALWVKDANRLVAFDEIAYAENLSARMKSIVKQYWREARSQKITVIAMKQRAQGAQRDMHSESVVTVAFRLEDLQDRERAAELFGSRRDFLPVLESLSRERHDFIMKWRGEVVRSWVDVPLRPAEPRRRTAYGQ